MKSNKPATGTRGGGYEWPDDILCFGYGEHLQHLDFKSFREFVETEYRKNAGTFGKEIPDRYKLLTIAYRKNPAARPWIFCFLSLFDAGRPCNMRPFLVPSYGRLVKGSGRSKSGFQKERKGREKLLAVARHLKAALDLDAEAASELLKDWTKDGLVSWERHDRPKPELAGYNRARAIQHIEILNRRWKHGRLPPRINDYDPFLFNMLVSYVKRATGATEEAIRNEIGLSLRARGIKSGGPSVLRKIAREPHYQKTALRGKPR